MTDTHGTKLLQLLEDRGPAGATGSEIKAHTRATVSTYVSRYVKLGQVGYIDEPAKRPRGVQVIRRYWLRAHCPPGAVLASTARAPRVITRKPAAPLDQPGAEHFCGEVKPRPPLTPSQEFATSAPRITERTKVTICPAGKDQRFTATHAPAFFSAGHRLEPRPWVAAITRSAP